MKITNGEDAIAITSWSEEIESKIAMVDEDVDKLAAFLTGAEKRETEKARRDHDLLGVKKLRLCRGV